MTIQDTSPTLGWIVQFVADVPASVAFYDAAFGLAMRFSPDHEYAELETGATTLALCDRAFAAQTTRVDIPSVGLARNNITLVYADVDAAFARAVAAGATSVHEPVTKPWGQRCSFVTDLDGHLIEIASIVPS